MDTKMYYLRYLCTGLIAITEIYHGRPITALAAFLAANLLWTHAQEYFNTRHNQKQTQRWLQRTTPDHDRE